MRCLATVLATMVLLSADCAFASSTTTYSYDVHGRLVDATTTGTVNNGAHEVLTYDATDNRTSYKVTGSKAKSVVVVPLNGLTVIPLGDNE